MADPITFTLRFSAGDPPLAAMAVASLATYYRKALSGPELKAGLNLKVIPGDSTRLETSPRGFSPMSITGSLAIARCIAKVSDARNKSAIGGGKDLVCACEIEMAIQYAETISAHTGNAKTILTALNAHFEHRSVMCGSAQLTLGDCTVWEALMRNPVLSKVLKSSGCAKTYPHLARWWSYVYQTPQFTQAKVAFEKASSKPALKSDTKEPKKKKGESHASFDIPLPGAVMGKVVTRFPPEPSGYLHIGHAKAVLLNDFFAKHWKGKCLLRFDDTNPEKESQEFVDNIMGDLKTLGIKHEPPTTTSDHFETILAYADKFIDEGLAYVDDTPVEEMRAQRMDGIESDSRKLPVAEHKRRWGEMKKGSEYGLKCVLRAKIGMQHPNKCMRDPAIYRCKSQPHHKTGTKYKVYPTYDFACPIVDSVEGVTHALRTVEYKDRDQQYRWFIEKLKLRPVNIWSYSRLNMRYTVMSKRKLKQFVEWGRVDGWNDPRFPTVQGVLRRGLTVDSLREFILRIGASQAENMMSWDKCWAINKQNIDPVAHRFLAVSKEANVPFKITNFTDPRPDSVAGCTEKKVRLHPKYEEIGFKQTLVGETLYLEQEDATLLKEGDEFTVMRLGNAIVTKIERDGDGKALSMEGKLHLTGNFKKTKYKLSWIANPSDAKQGGIVDVVAVEFDALITKPKLDDGDVWTDFLTPKTRFETHLLGEEALRGVKENQIIQLERRGFFRVDKNVTGPDGKQVITMFNIPTGKAKSMSSVSTKVAIKQ